MKIKLEDDPKKEPQVKKDFETLTEGLLSVSDAKKAMFKNAPRVQMAFSNVPKPVSDAFKEEASKNDMELKEFLYYCLRAGGVEIPDLSSFDARKR